MTSQERSGPASVWDSLEGIAYGGDYNPEQWPAVSGWKTWS